MEQTTVAAVSAPGALVSIAMSTWMNGRVSLTNSLSFFSLAVVCLSTGSNDPISATSTRYFLAWISSLFVIDWLLSILIIIALYRTRSGVQHTDRLVMRIIRCVTHDNGPRLSGPRWLIDRLSAEAQLLPSIA